MDSVPNSRPGPAENLAHAIKKAKYERARKAVNNSFDRSIGSLRNRRQKLHAAHNQSFVMKQAAALQLKNRTIVQALVRSRQYIAQLEAINFSFKNQQMALATKLASREIQLLKLQERYEILQRKCNLRESVLSPVHKHLVAALQAFNTKEMEHPGFNARSVESMYDARQNSQRTLDSNASQRTVDIPTSPLVRNSSPQASKRTLKSPSSGIPVLSQGNGEITMPLTVNYGSQSKIVPLSPKMPTLAEEEEGYRSEDETASYIDMPEHANVSPSRLYMPDAAETAMLDHNSALLNSPDKDDSVFLVSDEEIYDSPKSCTSTKLNATKMDRDCSSADVASVALNSSEKVMIHQSVFMVTSSESGSRAGSEGTGRKEMDNYSEFSGYLPSHSNTARKSCQVFTAEETSDQRVATENLSSRPTGAKVTARKSSQGNTLISVSKKSAKAKQTKAKGGRKKTKVSPKKKAPARKSSPGKITKKKCPFSKSRKAPLKVKLPNESLDKSVFEFLSCSSDSFVLDESKRIELNPQPAVLPRRTQSSKPRRFYDRGKENEVPPSRRRRSNAIVSYAEPSLGTKLRRGDKFFSVLSDF